MIVEQLRLHPFAGTTDGTVRFGPGLNVVLGPNEAGKTTLAHALRRVLFSSGPITVQRFRAELEGFLPVSGGDTLRVSLDFRSGTRPYHLTREWTASRIVTSRLQVQDGTIIADPGAIERMVQEALGVKEGTYEHVLSVTQAELSTTVARLREDARRATGEFADVLRRSMYHADGVAVDRLVREVKQKIVDYFGRWDDERHRPEKGHDIDHPWEKGAGLVVKAYYEYRRADRAWVGAKEYEARLDEYVRDETALAETAERLARFIANHEGAIGDARRRSELSHTLAGKKNESVELRAALDQWPRAEEQLAALTEGIETLLARHALLSAEFKDAQERVRQQSARDQYSKAEALHARLIEEEQALASLVPVSETHLEQLRKDLAKVREIDVTIAARNLAVRITAIEDLDVRVVRDGEERPVHLDAGSASVPIRGSALSIRHQAWTIDAQSAGDDIAALLREREEIRQSVDRQLADLRVGSFEDAQLAHRAWREKTAQVQQTRAALRSILEGDSFEALAEMVKGMRVVSTARSPEEIQEELQLVAQEGGTKRAEQKRLHDQCQKWTATYLSHDGLLAAYTKCKTEEQAAEAALAAATPIPAEFSDAESFIQAFEEAQRESSSAEKALHALQRDRLAFEKDEPEQSCRELEKIVGSAKETFARVRARGEAYKRIDHELTGLLSEMDADLFSSYHRRVEELLAGMTSNKYSTVELKGSLPDRVEGNGKRLGIPHLSLGTLDVVAMAIRLAMAEKYVVPGDGFLLMDDPLVNMDPARQAATAECLQTFSLTRQIVILTCHPAHADLLGGRRITFGVDATSAPKG
jgi:exonuclease SbcC